MASREQRIGNWDRFIVVEENKASLAHFLSTEMSQRYGTHPGRELVVSGGFREILKVWSSDASRESLLELSSDHKEEDTRIVLHARDAAVRGYRQVIMLCRDTDVLVLLLAHRQDLCQEIWMFSGTSQTKRYIPVHKISLPEEKRKSLLAFHTITGCDTTSQFAGIGEQSALKIFRQFIKAHGTSRRTLSTRGNHFGRCWSICLPAVQPWDRRSRYQRRESSSISQDKKNLDSLPPTKDALHLHIQRVNFQCMIWKKAKEPRPSLSSPEENGWF